MIYKNLIRPVLFLFPPETIHELVIRGLKLFFRIPGTPWLIRRYTSCSSEKLQREFIGLSFPNPVGIAAGFDKQAQVFNELSYLGFGFVEIGTITPRPQPGNPKPRLFRLKKDKALINRMGFNNIGVEKAIEHLRKKNSGIIIGGNIGKNTLTPNEQAVEDYLQCFERLFDYVDYFVVNVSCPNISDMTELQDSEHLLKILDALQQSNRRKSKSKPILLKISPDLNFHQLDEIIRIVQSTGIQGVVATNTTITRVNLSVPQEKLDQIGHGGLSGLPIKDRSTEVIRYLAEKSGKSFLIIGVGGIFTPEDALEKLNAGADLIQVYTGMIYEGPMIARKINRKLLQDLKAQGS